MIIEDDIILNDIRSEANKNFNVNNIVIFGNQYLVFLKSIQKSVELHYNFWSNFILKKKFE